SLCRDGVVTAEIVLSRADYEDGAINVRINRLTGNKVVLSALSLWEYEREGVIGASGGPQGSGTGELGSILFGGIYPNPGRTDVKIRLTIPYEMNVAVKLYDVTGRMVDEVFAGRITGFHEVPIVSREIASGVYFVRIEADDHAITEKAIILR
ncbi:T9SS type A sorting domain-containing protein, partial [candidate division WOR-3 bacterium]|nr:T9SS type A sorting domain-containing protein [candidate division WOR-3 bacterium]